MTTETSTPAVPAAPTTASAPANTEALEPAPATSPITVNVSLGDLVAKALNPETPAAQTLAAQTPVAETPPAVVVAKPPKVEAPVEDPKGPTKAELRAQVTKLEGEKRCAAVLEALRPKLAKGMDAVMKGLLPTLDLTTDDAVKAAVEKLSKDMPALFAEPGADVAQPNIPTLPGALHHPGGVQRTTVGRVNAKGFRHR